MSHTDDIPARLQKLIFPGVGHFGQALSSLRSQGYAEPLKEYIASGKPYMGICIGMQALFESSDEAPGVEGLGVLPGAVGKFDSSNGLKVPHMGWNRATAVKEGAARYGLAELQQTGEGSSRSSDHFYFVHSYRVAFDPVLHEDCALTLTQYGQDVYLSSVQKGNIFATQCHPEKSGKAGLELLRAWLSQGDAASSTGKWLIEPTQVAKPRSKDGLTKRIVACLDVRSNDQGDLVVTKGESYDVREKAESGSAAKATTGSNGEVRNLGKPVDLAMRYYLEGADEVTFLNITSFRSSALQDQPMLAMTEIAAATIFVPLTIGGGIKDTVDPDGTPHSALEVAEAYFRAGADKVSIGSEAVTATESLLSALAEGEFDPVKAPASALTGQTGIERISGAYGNQAVVVSIDPRRVYLEEGKPAPPAHAWSVVSDGERSWWYACTIKGGRETRDVDVVQLARAVTRLGAGELLVNSIDADGQGKGFDRQLVDLVRRYTTVPVIASSGAGRPSHFTDIFTLKPLQDGSSQESSVEAALAAGIFHRKEVSIDQVKAELEKAGMEVRRETLDTGAAAEVQQAQGQELGGKRP